MGRARILVAASLFVLTNACGGEPSSTSPEGKMVVTGTVSSRLPVDNARVVAYADNGKRYWTYLDADRDFTLKLPVGQSFRVIIANQRAGGDRPPSGISSSTAPRTGSARTRR